MKLAGYNRQWKEYLEDPFLLQSDDPWSQFSILCNSPRQNSVQLSAVSWVYVGDQWVGTTGSDRQGSRGEGQLIDSQVICRDELISLVELELELTLW